MSLIQLKCSNDHSGKMHVKCNNNINKRTWWCLYYHGILFQCLYCNSRFNFITAFLWGFILRTFFLSYFFAHGVGRHTNIVKNNATMIMEILSLFALESIVVFAFSNFLKHHSYYRFSCGVIWGNIIISSSLSFTSTLPTHRSSSLCIPPYLSPYLQ